MKVQAKTFEEYFKKTGDREPELRQLDKLIQQTVPSQKPVLFDAMSYTMLGYGVFHYKSKSGREGDWPLIGLANQKNYISVYVCAAKDGKYLAEIYEKDLGKVDCGRSCIRFKNIEDINQKILKKVLKEAEELSKDGSNFAF